MSGKGLRFGVHEQQLPGARKENDTGSALLPQALRLFSPIDDWLDYVFWCDERHVPPSLFSCCRSIGALKQYIYNRCAPWTDDQQPVRDLFTPGSDGLLCVKKNTRIQLWRKSHSPAVPVKICPSYVGVITGVAQVLDQRVVGLPWDRSKIQNDGIGAVFASWYHSVSVQRVVQIEDSVCIQNDSG